MLKLWMFSQSAFKPHIVHFSSIKRITAKLPSIPRDMCQTQLKLAANFASLQSAGVCQTLHNWLIRAVKKNNSVSLN